MELGDFLEGIMKFTLESYVNDAGEIRLGLRREFCSNLLRRDLDDSHPHLLVESFEGVPPYPLYKRLARTLLQSITSGPVHRAHTKNMAIMNEDNCLKQKEEIWNSMILARGSELVQVWNSVMSYRQGKEMPNITESGSYCPYAKPHTILANLLSELSYDGVQSLLGLSHTVGTIREGLPRPRSVLLSSFTLPYRPQVNGCLLTHGARALAKHVGRSSEKFWGCVKGSDSNKNKHAFGIINHLITSCSWLNMHIVHPHGEVFEIRIAEGYGARWSADGNKVRTGVYLNYSVLLTIPCLPQHQL